MLTYQSLYYRVWVVSLWNYLLDIFKDVGRCWPLHWCFLQQTVNHQLQILTICVWNRLKRAQQNILVQIFHVNTLEGRTESHHFIQHASQGPNIRLEIIRHILPNLGARIIGSSSLSHAQITDFRDIHVPKLHFPIFVDKDIRWLQIPVNNLKFMKLVQPRTNLEKHWPNLLFLVKLLLLSFVIDLAKQIPIICILHDYVETLGLKERFLVRNDVGMFDWRQNPDLI